MKLVYNLIMEQDLLPPAHYEIYYIQSTSFLKKKVDEVLAYITQTYANFKCLVYSQNFAKHINEYYHQIKLTKRKIIFAAFLTEDNPQIIPIGGKRIFITQKPTTKDDLQIKTHDKDTITRQLIKRLQLDFVWVGLVNRIGVDIQEFRGYMVKQQDFQIEFEDTWMKHFYQIIQQSLIEQSQFNIGLLKDCNRKLQQSNENDITNKNIQQLVRSKFNSRTIIYNITNHPYLNLLLSRSYFNLIYIEGQILRRHQYFCRQIKTEFPLLSSTLNLDKFILLDDYIYNEYIFGCLKKVKKFINRTSDEEPFSKTIKKYHHDIIRQFRPSFDHYFLRICLVLKSRAACLKEAVGAIIVKNRTIISTGYNGTPKGTVNCYNGGCLVCNNSEKMTTQVLSCRCIHAEYNCILIAGIKQTPNSTLYSTKLPCLWCSKLIIQGRISKVVYIRSKYSSLEYENIQFVKDTFKKGGVYIRELDIPDND